MSIEELYTTITSEIGKVFFGQEETLRFSLAALFSGGHVLLEGVPGTAKTLLVRSIAQALNVEFKRIQMTPDLLPNDIIGSSIYRENIHEFEFRKGPVFTNFLLADELNRASAKTQSALLESMQERTVTHDGVTHNLADPFVVFATQNPVDQEGTYPLPIAQLDRFMFKIIIEYPDQDTEDKIYREHHGTRMLRDLGELGLSPVLTGVEVEQATRTITETHVREEVISYIRELIRATRVHDHILVGGSPRAGLMLLMGAKSIARFAGRDFVTPDDVKESFCPALRHRIQLAPVAELEGITPDDVLMSIMDITEVPR